MAKRKPKWPKGATLYDLRQFGGPQPGSKGGARYARSIGLAPFAAGTRRGATTTDLRVLGGPQPGGGGGAAYERALGITTRKGAPKKLKPKPKPVGAPGQTPPPAASAPVDPYAEANWPTWAKEYMASLNNMQANAQRFGTEQVQPWLSGMVSGLTAYQDQATQNYLNWAGGVQNLYTVAGGIASPSFTPTAPGAATSGTLGGISQANAQRATGYGGVAQAIAQNTAQADKFGLAESLKGTGYNLASRMLGLSSAYDQKKMEFRLKVSEFISEQEAQKAEIALEREKFEWEKSKDKQQAGLETAKLGLEASKFEYEQKADKVKFANDALRTQYYGLNALLAAQVQAGRLSIEQYRAVMDNAYKMAKLGVDSQPKPPKGVNPSIPVPDGFVAKPLADGGVEWVRDPSFRAPANTKPETIKDLPDGSKIDAEERASGKYAFYVKKPKGNVQAQQMPVEIAPGKWAKRWVIPIRKKATDPVVGAALTDRPTRTRLVKELRSSFFDGWENEPVDPATNTDVPADKIIAWINNNDDYFRPRRGRPVNWIALEKFIRESIGANLWERASRRAGW